MGQQPHPPGKAHTGKAQEKQQPQRGLRDSPLAEPQIVTMGIWRAEAAAGL